MFEERCGSSGTCLFYDNEDIALYLFFVVVSVKAASLLFIIVAWRTYKPPQKSQTYVQKASSANHVINGDYVTKDSDHVMNNNRVGHGYSPYNVIAGVGKSGPANGVVSPVFVNDDGTTVQSEEVTRF